MVQNGGGPVLRLKANKTSLYNLVATYKPLPGMRRVDFQKANGRRTTGWNGRRTTATRKRFFPPPWGTRS